MLVVDASVAVAASHSPVGLARFGSHELVAPHLMRAEAASVLHEMAWRKEIDPARGRLLLSRVIDSLIELQAPDELTTRLGALPTSSAGRRSMTRTTSPSPNYTAAIS